MSTLPELWLPSLSQELSDENEKQDDEENSNHRPNPHMRHHHNLFLLCPVFPNTHTASMFSFYCLVVVAHFLSLDIQEEIHDSTAALRSERWEPDFKIRLQYLIHRISSTIKRTSATNNKRPNRTETAMMYGIAAFSLFIIRMHISAICFIESELESIPCIC